MKTNIMNTAKIITALVLVLMSSGLKSQQGKGMRHEMVHRSDSVRHTCMMQDLTDDQLKKISDLATAHQKEMLNFRNDLAIKKAELQKYRSADKPDMALINKTIDEIGKLRTEMEKKRVAYELAVRGLLTDEQKVIFDSGNYCPLHGTGRSHRSSDTIRHMHLEHNEGGYRHHKI